MTALVNWLACHRVPTGAFLGSVSGWIHMYYPAQDRWAALAAIVATYLIASGLHDSDRAVRAARQWREHRHDRRRGPRS